jgi:CheY-like chemotaxis protein
VTGGATILLADDNRMDALLLARAFKRAGVGFTLRIVHDGEQVLQYFKGQGEYADRAQYSIPKLVLLDMRMPLVDGFEVLKWMRNQFQFCKLPVIVIGDCMSTDWMARAYECGASCVMSKTNNLENFGYELSKLIDGYLSIGSNVGSKLE